MPNEIVYYTSEESGAPTLNNAAGSLIAVLDACLIDGFGLKSVSSITVSSGVATVTCTAHGFADGRMVQIAGVTDKTVLNGRRKITVTNVNAFTFPTAATDGAASGTITAKRSALGWAKAYSGTNTAMYARTDAAASASMFRVDDTAAGAAGATWASTFAVESATSVDTYTGATSATTVEKGANSTTAKRWLLVGDSRTFYFFSENVNFTWSGYSTFGSQAAFGDLASFRAGDAYRAFVMGNRNTLTPRSVYAGSTITSTGLRVQRAANGVTTNVGIAPLGFHDGWSSNYPFACSNPASVSWQWPAYPSPVDNGLALQYPVLALENNSALGHPIRGAFPGLLAPLSALGLTLHGVVQQGVAGLGRDVLFVSYCTGTNPYYGCVAFDITGPWQ